MTSISQNLAHVRKRIEIAAGRAHRDPASIKLVAVSKTKTPTEIREAYNNGQRIFGENYAQELKEKAAELADLDIEWHFIGHLQKNKAKIVAPVAAWIETIDSFELAEAIDKRAAQTDVARRSSLVARKIKCLIEVNIGIEESKSGCRPDEIIALAQKIAALASLDLRGLMIIPPYNHDPEFCRPHFVKLRDLLARMNGALAPRPPLTELSMGMSHDFETAIEEGATIVRVGTAIFGDRG